MPVFSYKEFEKQKKPVVKEKKVFNDGLLEKKEKSNKIVEYTLLHPENEIGNYKNFEDEISINNIKYKRNCIKGILKTTEVELKKFLILKGYILLNEKQIEANK